jgi:hypothetical protein
MPKLVGYLDPAPDAPGVVIPLFRETRRANIDLAQIIDANGVVRGFRKVIPPNRLFLQCRELRTAEVGKLALWAFKDHRSVVHIGYADELMTVARDLLKQKGLRPWPLARLELGRFAYLDAPQPELLQDAYRSIQHDDGELAADVWRDTEVFAPAMRRDIYEHVGEREPLWTEAIVLLVGDRLEVFVDKPFAQRLNRIKWTRTEAVLRALKVRATIVIRQLGELSRQAPAPHWRALGVGGVARFVLKQEPFRGHPHHFWADREAGVFAEGLLKERNGASQLFAVCQSAPDQLELMARQGEAYPPDVYVRHLVNVRPFSFGSPPAGRVPVEAVPELARDFDYNWVIAGHRQRKTGNYRNQLSVSNAASRLVKTLLLSILRRADVITEITSAGFSTWPAVNLFGMVRARSNWSLDEWARNLLHAMLCEEALLHTAQRIVALVPGEVEMRDLSVRLGRHVYRLDFIPDPGANRSSELIGWALGVDLPEGTSGEFSDFCAGLVEGYQWTYRGADGDMLLFEDEGLPLRVWPAHDLAALQQLLEGPSSGGRSDLIITPITIRAEWQRRADDLEWSLVHYSDLPQLFAEHYQKRRFVGDGS